MIRSRSCIATFESYDFNDSKAKAPLGVCATPSTNCSSVSDGNNRGPFALSLDRYDGLDSCGSDAVDNEAVVAEQFQKYPVNTENENELDYQYPGYIVRAKNTFIDVTIAVLLSYGGGGGPADGLVGVSCR